MWTCKDIVTLPVGRIINYKYVKYNKSNGEAQWEDSLSYHQFVVVFVCLVMLVSLYISPLYISLMSCVQTVCGWDKEREELLTVRSHDTKGVIRQTRRCVVDETYGILQHSRILLTPPQEADPTVNINLWFAPAQAYAEQHP
eukprot:GHVS01060742.1.p3 GENE.GHVS01060742.1~~GHVS01060742.1.p3  ORF type:complete len:142 (-),score=13.45 GHVS01060742.1:256-681(-)